VVTASGDKTPRLWDNLNTQVLIDRACKLLPRKELTKPEKEQFFVPSK
jgi:hypothetical protein